MDDMTDIVVCSLCARGLWDGQRIEPGSPAGPRPRTDPSAQARAAAATAGWSRETGAGGVVTWVCPACVRRHIRSIEARLDEAWW